MRWTFIPCLLAVATAAAVPRDDERQPERFTMVQEQIVARGIRDEKVLAALRAVPRHVFVPADFRPASYEDRPLPIGLGQTISQPYIVALMTELAGVRRDSRVLEIGTGSGYQAAILGELSDHVFTIEIVPALARRARATLRQLGYTHVNVREGDGYAGWPEEAPFDVIIVTAAPDEIPAPLLEQLKEGGRMVIPVGPQSGSQRLEVVTKQDGTIRRHTVLPVRFVPFTRAPE